MKQTKKIVVLMLVFGLIILGTTSAISAVEPEIPTEVEHVDTYYSLPGATGNPGDPEKDINKEEPTLVQYIDVYYPDLE